MSAPPRPPDTGVSPISPAWAPGSCRRGASPGSRGAPPADSLLRGGSGGCRPPSSAPCPPRRGGHPLHSVQIQHEQPPHRVEVPEGHLAGAAVLRQRAHRYASPPPAAPPGLPLGGFFPLHRLPPDPAALPAEPYKDRVQFTSTNIRFSTVTREDTGKYICEVVDGSSQISKSEVSLIVQGAPLAPPHPRSAPLSVPESPLPPPPCPHCHSEGASWGGGHWSCPPLLGRFKEL